jgi:hypothetical protein
LVIGRILVPGRQTELLRHPQRSLYRASFSPDETSVIFTAKRALEKFFVAGFHDGRRDSEWVPGY